MAFERDRQRIIVYAIIAALLVAVVGLFVYAQFTGNVEVASPQGSVASVGGLSSDEASQPFDVAVLEDPQYTSLNRSLLDAGRIPVAAPQARGKPNLFGQ